MKKIVFLVIAVVLIAAAVGGFAYAQSQNAHQPMVGQKLVGWGPLGQDIGPGDTPNRLNYGRLLITNPDCVSEITIDRISIMAGNATVIYEGELLLPDGSEKTILKPHETAVIDLASYFILKGIIHDPNDLLSYPMPPETCTVEVSWAGSKGGLPLTGWAWMATATYDDNGSIIESVSTSALSQMINMTQLVTKGK